MISASSSPSPRSGSRKSGMVAPLELRDGVQDAVVVRQVQMLQVRRRVGDVQAGDTQDRRLEVVEALLGQPGDDLGSVTGEPRSLVYHHGPAGAAHRLGQRGIVER